MLGVALVRVLYLFLMRKSRAVSRNHPTTLRVSDTKRPWMMVGADGPMRQNNPTLMGRPM